MQQTDYHTCTCRRTGDLLIDIYLRKINRNQPAKCNYSPGVINIRAENSATSPCVSWKALNLLEKLNIRSMKISARGKLPFSWSFVTV